MNDLEGFPIPWNRKMVVAVYLFKEYQMLKYILVAPASSETVGNGHGVNRECSCWTRLTKLVLQSCELGKPRLLGGLTGG